MMISAPSLSGSLISRSQTGAINPGFADVHSVMTDDSCRGWRGGEQEGSGRVLVVGGTGGYWRALGLPLGYLRKSSNNTDLS